MDSCLYDGGFSRSGLSLSLSLSVSVSEVLHLRLVFGFMVHIVGFQIAVNLLVYWRVIHCISILDSYYSRSSACRIPIIVEVQEIRP